MDAAVGMATEFTKGRATAGGALARSKRFRPGRVYTAAPCPNSSPPSSRSTRLPEGLRPPHRPLRAGRQPEREGPVFLHGGPGGGLDPDYRRYFDPAKWHVDALRPARQRQEHAPRASCARTPPGTSWPTPSGSASTSASTSGSSSAAAGAARSPSPTPRRTRSAAPASCCAGSSSCAARSCSGSTRRARAGSSPTPGTEYLKPIPEVERGDLMGAYYRRLTSADPAVRGRPPQGLVDLGGHDEQAPRRPRLHRPLRRRRLRGRLRPDRGALLRPRGLAQERRPSSSTTSRRSRTCPASSSRAATTWCARRRARGRSTSGGRSRSS